MFKNTQIECMWRNLAQVAQLFVKSFLQCDRLMTARSNIFFILELQHNSFKVPCGEGGVVQQSLQREKDSGDSGK